MDSIEIHASMGDVKIERASAANPEDVEIILAEKVYQATVEEGPAGGPAFEICGGSKRVELVPAAQF